MQGVHLLLVLLACAHADDGGCINAVFPPGFDLSDQLLVPQAQVPICTTTTTTSSSTSTSSTTASSSTTSATTTTMTMTSSTSSSGTSTTSTSSSSTVTTVTSTSSSLSQTSSSTLSMTETHSTSSTTSSLSTSRSSTNGTTSTTSTTFQDSTTTSTGTFSSTTTSTTTTSSTSTTTSTTTASLTSTSISATNTSTTSSTSTSVSTTSSTSTSASTTSSTRTFSSTTTSTRTATSTTTSTFSSTSTLSHTTTTATSTSVSTSTTTRTVTTVTSSSLSFTSSTASTRTMTFTSSTGTSTSVSITTSTATTFTSTSTLSSTATSTSKTETTSTMSYTTTSSATTSSSTTSSSTFTSSTSSSSTSTSSTTTTTPAWCDRFYTGLPPLKEHNCSLQEGDICEVTFENEETEETSPNQTAYWCYETMGPQELLCGRSGVILPVSRAIRCQVCAVGSFEDMEDERGKISGTVYWGRNAIDGEIDESLVDGYDVWLVDSCGEQYLQIAQVTKLNWIQENGCCDPAAYNYTFGILDMPQEHMSLMISPFKAEDRLLAGTLIPIQERTTTTTTSSRSSTTTTATSSVTTNTVTRTSVTSSTETTWTTSSTTATASSTQSTTSFSTTTVTSYIPISAVLRGCFGIAINDPASFASMPEAKDAIKEVVAGVAGSEVLTTYVQDVLLQQGASCVSRRLSPLRRLQASLRADYVIVIPATPDTESLGGAEAIGRRAKNAIELFSIEEATTLLRDELQRVRSLRNFTASITSIGIVRLQPAVDPLIIPSGGYERVTEAEREADNSAAIAALIACTTLLLTAVMCGGLFLVRRQLKMSDDDEDDDDTGLVCDPDQDSHSQMSPTSPMSPMERLTGGLPTSLRQNAQNEGVQNARSAENECSLPPDLPEFPELEAFNNEDVGTFGPAPCIECSKSTMPCCGRL